MSAGVALCQRLQQYLGLLKVGGVKALSEPAVDRCQQRAGFGVLALALPQPAQAHGRPQLERFRLLVAGDVQGVLQQVSASACGVPVCRRSKTPRRRQTSASQ